MAKTFAERMAGFLLCKCSADCINQTKTYQAQQPATPAPAPDPTHCPCGAELMGAKAKAILQCGDCHMVDVARVRDGIQPADLDTRIKAAAKPDPDPTSGWGAWASPSWES